jgi:hypothetical protein
MTRNEAQNTGARAKVTETCYADNEFFAFVKLGLFNWREIVLLSFVYAGFMVDSLVSWAIIAHQKCKDSPNINK